MSNGFVFARLTLSLLLVLLADRCMCDKAAVEKLELSGVVSSNIVKYIRGQFWKNKSFPMLFGWCYRQTFEQLEDKYPNPNSFPGRNLGVLYLLLKKFYCFLLEFSGLSHSYVSGL